MKRFLILALIALAAAPAMAAQQEITTITGATASREALRNAVNSRFTSIEANFDELYAGGGSGDDLGAATYSDVVGLWTTCTGYLRSDGTCGTPSGTFSWPTSDGAYYAAKDGAWASLTGLYQAADTDLTDLADGSLTGSKVATSFTGTLLTGITAHSAAIQAIATELDNAVDLTEGTGIDITAGVISATAASTTAAGISELSISSEVDTGTDATRAVTPDSLAGSIFGQKEAGFTITASDTATAVADGKQYFSVPAGWNGMNLVDVTCSVHDLNSAASGTTTVVVRRVRGATAVDMTSTGVTIDYNAYTASDETVDTSNDDIATGDKLFFDVNAVTTAAQKGLSCSMTFQLP